MGSYTVFIPAILIFLPIAIESKLKDNTKYLKMPGRLSSQLPEDIGQCEDVQKSVKHD